MAAKTLKGASKTYPVILFAATLYGFAACGHSFAFQGDRLGDCPGPGCPARVSDGDDHRDPNSPTNPPDNDIADTDTPQQSPPLDTDDSADKAPSGFAR
jgi:hypothetical protein